MRPTRKEVIERGNRRGVTLVFAAALITVLVGMGAVGMDFGRMYMYKAQLQASADAGAMAGALELVRGRPTTVLAKAKLFALSNHVDGTHLPAVADSQVRACHWNFASPNNPPCDVQTLAWTDPAVNAVQVRSRYLGSYLLGRALGATTVGLYGVSVAALGSATTSSGCLKPWAVPLSNMKASLGQPATDTSALTAANINQLISNRTAITFHISSPGATDSNTVGTAKIAGNYYAVDFPPFMDKNNVPYPGQSPKQGSPPYVAAISGCTGHARVGDWLTTEPGMAAGPTKQAVDSLCLNNIKGNPSGMQACSNQAVIEVPIYGQAATKAGRSAVQVRYIGEFKVTGRDKNGYVQGYLTAMKTTGGGGFSGAPGPVIMAALVK